MNELQDFLKLANEQFGDNTAIIIDENTKIDVEVIPSGIRVIDNAIGIGGIPRGRITEVYGKEASGKTTLCLHVIAQAQKMGLNAAFIDAEHALNLEMLQRLGVDTSKLVFSQPNSGEQALDLAEMMVRSGNFAVIVIDSVAALTPQVEVEKDFGESVMGVHGKLMSQAMRKLTAPVSKYKVAMMFTNQTRANIGGYGSPEVTTGGNALKFYASLRLRMQLIGQIKNSAGQRTGGKYKMTVVKNKMAVPFKEAEFEITQRGIDATGNFIDLLVEKGVVEKSGSFYKLEGVMIAQGKPALIEKINQDPELKTTLSEKLHKQT